MSTLRHARMIRVLSGCVAVMLITAGALAMAWRAPQLAGGERNFATFRREQGLRNPRMPIAFVREKLEKGAEASREVISGPAQEAYDNRAYPSSFISLDQSMAAAQAYNAVDQRTRARPDASSIQSGSTWKELGPITPNVPAPVTYTGRPTTNSGRVTSLAVAPGCSAGSCTLYVGAAGGGIWKTSNALAAKPSWKPSSNGIASNAIGVVIVDPTDSTGKTLYVGTGEPNGSSDSEAGVGLYKSTDAGASWSLVAGSLAVAKDRAIGAVAIDPTDAKHIYIGTAVARHGSSSVNGGRFTPPDAPQIGVYESTDGGATFTLAFSQEGDTVNPGSPNGSDFFSGGVTDIELDPRDPATVYAGLFNYGLWRRSARLDGNTEFHQVFAAVAPDLFGERIEFALAEKGPATRIYLGAGSAEETDDQGNVTSGATFWRVDDANVPAASLSDGTTNAGWTELSNSANGTPGFASFDFCSGQCSYDMFVASPPGHPDEVWIGGQMQYGELVAFGSPVARSNGRAVQRSTDAGVNFTDMTDDSRSPAEGMHPDQHAIAFAPGDSGVAFVGSDGGVVRTNGKYVDRSSECAARGLSAADLADCTSWLKVVPERTDSLNDGLATLQFQSVSVNARNAPNDVLGGTQDNGTWAFSGSPAWFESVGGDGGQSGIDVENPKIRMHSYYDAQHDVNFRGTDPFGWNWISDPLLISGEAQSFYVPLINDPRVGGSWFVGLQHVWRTTDNGGDQAFLEQHCNEATGDFTVSCGDWEALGGEAGPGTSGDLVSPLYGSDKRGSYVVAVERSRSDKGTLWAATRRGRLFISKNADAAKAADVTFTRIDTPNTPTRFISGIAIDRDNPNHAWVSFSGYDAYAQAAGTATGHVFDVTYDPAAGTASWKDISFDLGDQPITDIARDQNTGDLFASTDFGVLYLTNGSSSWATAAPGLPPVAVYGLTVSPASRTLFAATHGRGVWRLRLK
ncbi:MAG TPA: hypothetical protein PLO33_04970 [Kouleothrix sp.]|uniref:WD40/YVTN/BNR-like repeat-containing protein n=1 Tax=Kouleothrix sp. TaxID=2779161 RepID=UPI002CA35319|nr:hypothetical protein [Kouleothrix sp.]HRC75007.1 hypothetical protein [Kouleothrix sp.]